MDHQDELRTHGEQLHAAREQLHAIREQLHAIREQLHTSQERAERAERAAVSALEQNLADFLRGCHELYRKIGPVTDLSTATRGRTSDPTYYLFPERIVQWKDFHRRQQEEWTLLKLNESVWTDKLYPSIANLNFIGSRISPVGSEDALRYIERLTLENMVKTMFESIELHPETASNGNISFANRTRFRSNGSEDLTRSTGTNLNRRHARNIRTDQFCIFRQRDEGARPVVAIEYKAPHRLTIEEICTGLKCDIWPARDVIDKHEETFKFCCKNLMATVITQLFAYMIDCGLQYGFISTGEAFIFGHIPDDPTSFQYSVNIPRDDYVADSDNHLERTAVAQVFAFTLQALRAGQPGADWSEQARDRLSRWKVEFLDVLATIPIAERNSREASAYEPSLWLTLPEKRRRYELRSSSNDSSTKRRMEDDECYDDPANANFPRESKVYPARQTAIRGNRRKQPRRKNTAQHRGNVAKVEKISIEGRPYCTQKCLQGLRSGQPIDHNCPNALEHGSKHIPNQYFLDLLRHQIDVDRGRDADCLPLHLYGALGALFKVRLSAYGYTFVAKGMENALRSHIVHERMIYQVLEPLQAQCIPVCCGLIYLNRPLFFDGVPLDSFLILSFSGRSLVALEKAGEMSERLEQRFNNERIAAIQKIKALGVDHGDEANRNCVYDPRTETFMIIDFDRSTIIDKALKPLSPNRKRPAEPIIRPGKRVLGRDD